MLLCCGVLWLYAGCGKSPDGKARKTQFEIDKNYERGPITVHVRADKAKMTIAETVLLELEAAIEPGYEVRMPKVDKVLESFGIVDWDNLGDKLDPNNRVVSTYRYRLEPFLSGTYPIPAFTFEFHDANSPEDKKYELTTEPIDIEVTSLLGEQRAELKIDDIEDVMEMPKQKSFTWVWALVVIAATAAAGLWLYLRGKRVKELVRIFKPAHEIAYGRLRALVKEDLVGAGKIKEFYERISDILRHYIEHRFSLRAPERTTEEFLAELASTELLPAAEKQRLGEFLQHCDLVKFAKHNPTTQQIQETFDLVKDFIEKTKSDERKVDVTDMTGSEEAVTIGNT
ncbi:MAG: hypothetical protein A2168_03665 [Planctomycetes bacterium RBG_13_50_24]|nr:MAG: hypothetical protein A2168_03665 [Planctomycetes bacterium RBG_13_50_24]